MHDLLSNQQQEMPEGERAETGADEEPGDSIHGPDVTKDPVAVELGRRGGLKGGKARAASLSAEQRRAIAQKAAQARWGGTVALSSNAPAPAEGSSTEAEQRLERAQMGEPIPAARPPLEGNVAGPRELQSREVQARLDAGASDSSAQASTRPRREPSRFEWEQVLRPPGTDSPSQLRLTDWRRRISDLYSEVRRLARHDPEEAWGLWCGAREALYRKHPLSPVPADRRDTFVARHFPYNPELRFELPVRADVGRGHVVGDASNGLVLPSSGPETMAFERVGRIDVPIGGSGTRLSLFWVSGYAGGLFLPFRDATNGRETYGAGRYLLDTAKGADLGGGHVVSGSIVVDFNFAFQPSCAFDPRWACPLAPPENRIDVPIRAGERIS